MVTPLIGLMQLFTLISPFVGGLFFGGKTRDWEKKVEVIFVGALIGIILSALGVIGVLLTGCCDQTKVMGILIFGGFSSAFGTLIGRRKKKVQSDLADDALTPSTEAISEKRSIEEKSIGIVTLSTPDISKEETIQASNLPRKKTIGVGTILIWAVSISLILSGIGNSQVSLVGGLLILMSGILIFPPFNKLLEKKMNIALTPWLKILGVLVMVSIGGNLIAQSQELDDEFQRSISTISPQPTLKPSSAIIDKNNITTVSKDELEDMIKKSLNKSSDEGEGSDKNEYDLGEFYLVVHPPENKKYLDYTPSGIDKGGIEKFFKSILYFYNTILALPIEEGVPVNLAECGTANAFYSSKDKYIVFCYEMIELLDEMAIAKYGISFLERKYYEPGAIVDWNSEFILGHELAHAFIDIYGLPITGREEDAADQLATVVMANNCRLGFCADLSGRLVFVAEQWKMQAQLRKMAGYDPSYWDVHAIDEQRYFNILCWTYGSDPVKFESIVETGELPVSRARTCQDEFDQMSSSWGTLLEPYLTHEQPTIEGLRDATLGEDA